MIDDALEAFLVAQLKAMIDVLEENHSRLVEIQVLKPVGMQESIHSVIQGLHDLIREIEAHRT